ncbi:MAG: hypothetical protein RLZ98_2570 [Pseudomonadota bacterium]
MAEADIALGALQPHYPVVVAGAGPVGLALAAEFGLAGVSCLLAEKRDGTIHVPKMSLVCAGTMEVSRRWGIAKDVRRAVWAENRAMDFLYIESLKGREFARVKLPSYTESPPPWTPEGICHCPQIYFDPILSKCVAGMHSVTRRNNLGIESFTDDGDRVRVTVRDSNTGESREITADYLAGCDGPGGIVRESLGIELDGKGRIANSTNIFFRSPELSKLHDKGWGRIYRVIDETGCWGELIPIDGDVLWRLTVFDDPQYVEDPDKALRHMMGADFPYEILSTLPWERRDFVAQSYGRGRVYIAGDAAHQSSPTGGVGMHTGVEDAVNLAWKLTAMVEGWGGPRLLETYEAERKPVAQRNVDLSTSTFEAIRRIPGSAGQERRTTGDWRDDMDPLYIPDIVRSRYCYKGSQIIAAPDGDEVSPKAGRTPGRPGWRAPHEWIGDGRSTLDLFGSGFVLLRLGPDAPDAAPLESAARERGVPLTLVTVSDEKAAAAFEKPLVLVRPDRHIAWHGDACPDAPQQIIDLVRGA